MTRERGGRKRRKMMMMMKEDRGNRLTDEKTRDKKIMRMKPT